MNEVASWWALSLVLGCLCALFAYPPHRQSFFGAHRYCRRLPRMLSRLLYLTVVPLSLAVVALALSGWLTEQSVPAWLAAISGYGKVIGVALSLQALCLLLHRRMYGSWILLATGALSFQLWLFYQALGVDFSLLGRLYGAALFIAFTAAIAAVGRVDPEARWAVARLLAFLLLALQWLFATGSGPAADFTGFDWLTPGMAVLTPSAMLALTLIGFSWQSFASRVARARG